MTKVRRIRDGKIFSSPRGVAMSIGKPVSKAVYYCCKGYILAVEGEKYEWAYDEDLDRGRVNGDASYWRRRGKWTAKHAAWTDRNSVREILFQRSITFKLWLDRINDPERWRAARELSCELSNVYLDTCDSIPQFPWIFNSTTISRHLHAYNLIYQKLLGMHEHFFSVPGFKGWKFKFVREEADPEFDIITDEIVEGTRKGAKPVIRLNDGTFYESMRKAEEETGIPYYRIFHCCEGDIPYFEFLGVQWEFRYATELRDK